MAEGAPLLRAYRRNPIEGSNPSFSARHKRARQRRAFLCLAEKESGKNPPVRKPRSGADRAKRGPEGARNLRPRKFRVNPSFRRAKHAQPKPPTCNPQQHPSTTAGNFCVWRRRSLVRTLRFESRVAAQTAQSAARRARVLAKPKPESIPPSGVQSTPSQNHQRAIHNNTPPPLPEIFVSGAEGVW